MADSIISELSSIEDQCQNAKGDKETLQDTDLFVVSHNFSPNSGKGNHTTYNVQFKTIREKLTAAAYNSLFEDISTDLKLKDLAHKNEDELGLHNLAYQDYVTDDSFDGENRLTPAKALAGIGDLIYTNRDELELSALSHKDVILSTDLSAKGRSSNAHLSALDIHSINYPFGDLIGKNEKQLNLRKLAGQDYIVPGDLHGQLDIDTQTTHKQYVLSVANTADLGGIKLGYSQNKAQKNFPVQLDSSNRAYVHVELSNVFENTATTFTGGTNSFNITTTTTKTVDNSTTTLSTKKETIKITPYIANNVVSNTASSTARSIAVFQNTNNMVGSGPSFSTAKDDKYLAHDGQWSTIPDATTSKSGLMTAADKIKLANLKPYEPSIANEKTIGSIKAKTYSSRPSNAYDIGVVKDTGESFAVVQIADNSDIIGKTVFDAVYPVNSIYMTSQNGATCPLEGKYKSHWVRLENSAGKCLQAPTDAELNANKVGTTKAAGLPDHTHRVQYEVSDCSCKKAEGIRNSHAATSVSYVQTESASRSNSIYGRSDTVQPPAILVNVFRRVS